MAKGRGRWRGPLAEVCPSYRAGAAPRQFPLQLGIPAGGGAGRRASPCLSRSSHPPASPLTVNSTLSSQGCPCWQCPASPTGQGELRNKPNRPHCAGCRSAAENSESAPPALNHEIILWVTGVTFCVRGTREPPVPQPRRHHRARGTLLRAPPHKGTSACAKHWEPKPHQANTLPRFCASGGGGGGAISGFWAHQSLQQCSASHRQTRLLWSRLWQHNPKPSVQGMKSSPAPNFTPCLYKHLSVPVLCLGASGTWVQQAAQPSAPVND